MRPSTLPSYLCEKSGGPLRRSGPPPALKIAQGNAPGEPTDLHRVGHLQEREDREGLDASPLVVAPGVGTGVLLPLVVPGGPVALGVRGRQGGGEADLAVTDLVDVLLTGQEEDRVVRGEPVVHG